MNSRSQVNYGALLNRAEHAAITLGAEIARYYNENFSLNLGVRDTLKRFGRSARGSAVLQNGKREGAGSG